MSLNALERFHQVVAYAVKSASSRFAAIFHRSNQARYGSKFRRYYRSPKNCERRRATSRAPGKFMPQEFSIQAGNSKSFAKTLGGITPWTKQSAARFWMANCP